MQEQKSDEMSLLNVIYDSLTFDKRSASCGFVLLVIQHARRELFLWWSFNFLRCPEERAKKKIFYLVFGQRREICWKFKLCNLIWFYTRMNILYIQYFLVFNKLCKQNHKYLYKWTWSWGFKAKYSVVERNNISNNIINTEQRRYTTR